MAIRTGTDYIKALREPRVWHRGRRIEYATTHAASREGDRIMSKRALTLCFVIFFAHATVTTAQELKKVRIGYPSLGFRQGHIWVAKDQGLFRKHGLDVEPIFLRGGQLAIQALAAGDPPIMSIGQVVQANLSGFDLALVAGVERFYDFTIFARPGITRLEQLKGKRLGISGYGIPSGGAENHERLTLGRSCPQ